MQLSGLSMVRLSAAQAHEIYDRHLKKDFPPDEVKPFSAILSMMQRGCYEAYGAYENGELAAYAFYATTGYKGKRIALLDYYAVVSDRRGRGIGTAVLKLLSPGRLSLACVLIECERPARARTEEEQAVREKRILFYERCGACRTGVGAKLYGVEYDILILREQDQNADTGMDQAQAYALTTHMYHSMYEASWFPKLADVYMYGSSRQRGLDLPEGTEGEL